jgi:Ribonuclease G/E
MSGERRLFLDRSPGEARGVVTLDGRLERLILEREGELVRPRLGEVWRGRVRATPRGFRGAFVDLGLERDGLMKAEPGAGALHEGAIVEAEVAAEGRDDKGPALRLLARGAGAPGRLTPGPSLEDRLAAFAPGAAIETGDEASILADEAETLALARACRVAPDLTITLDQTRGMTAVDVDFADAQAHRKSVAAANRQALRETARLARLKGLGGLIVIDLIGAARGHPDLIAAAQQAFAPDQPGVVFAGVSRLGVFEIAKPWRERPVAETLLDRDGRLSARSMAQRLLRQMARQARADPGAPRVTGRCAPEVALEAQRFLPQMGPRFALQGQPGRDRLSLDVASS